MRNDEGYSDKSVLYHLLLEHDRLLRQYVDRRLPADVRNTLSLEEILQEIWILVFRDIPGFHPDDPDAVDHRLKLIAMRTVRRSVRATRAINRREVFRFLRAHSDSRSFDGARIDCNEVECRTPSREVVVREIATAVRDVISKLPADRQQAIQMRYFDGKSLEEIGEALGKSREATRGLINRSKCQMRSMLGSAKRYFSDAPSTGL